MANPVLVAAPVALVPAVAALWYLLRRYEPYFDDARVFLSLTIGFFAGLVAAFFEQAVIGFHTAQFTTSVGVGTAFLFYVIGYALLETAMKLVVLGSKGYRTRKDTPYYGAALGLGMGAMMGIGFIAGNLNASQDGSQTGLRALPFLFMALLPTGATLAHGATGVFVGHNTAGGRMWRALAIGAALQAPVLACYWLFLPSIGADVVVILPGALALAYGAALLLIARVRVLDHVVPKEIADQVRREQRRQQRRA